MPALPPQFQDLTPEGLSQAARILSSVDGVTRRTILEEIAKTTPRIAALLKHLMFPFEAVAELSDKDLRTLLADVDYAALALALRGLDPKVSERILSGLSERAATMVREDVEVMGPRRLSEVEEARTQITRLAREMADKGFISLRDDPDDPWVE